MASCHMGMVSGRLTVVSPATKKNGRSRWVCKCECGAVKEVAAKHLLTTAIKSCGCLLKEKARERFLKREPLESMKRRMYLTYVSSARSRGIEMCINEDQMSDIASMNCHYCGSEPRAFSSRLKTPHDPYMANGLDRVDSEIGYVVGNVVPCCKVCNMAKGTMTNDEFIEMCNMVVSHSNRKVGLDA